MNELDRVRAAYPPLPDETLPTAISTRLRSLYADAAQAPARGSEEPAHRRRRRPSRRAGLLAVATVIVSGTAVAATSNSWRPLLGSADRPRPAIASSGVPADQLAALAVLRRPQTETDRGPLVQAALRKLDRRTINGIHTDAIRVISHGRREVTLLIPAQRFGRRVKGLPSSETIQRDVLYLMSGSYQNARTWKITSGGKPKTVRFPAGYGWGGTYGTLEALRTTGIQTGTSPDGNGLVLDGQTQRVTSRRITLVPDGVARVQVRLRGGRYLTVPVRNNVYRYTVRGPLPPSWGATWYDAAGRRIDHRKRS